MKRKNKTKNILKEKLFLISTMEQRSLSSQMERFLKQGINRWEKENGPKGPKKNKWDKIFSASLRVWDVLWRATIGKWVLDFLNRVKLNMSLEIKLFRSKIKY